MDSDEFDKKFERTWKKKKEAGKVQKTKKVVSKPTNLEEFLGAEGLLDWPHPVSIEGPLNIQNEGLLLGSQKDIAALLKDAAPFNLGMLKELDVRLNVLEKSLKHYADEILTDEVRESRLADRLFHSPSRTFMTEISESDAVKSHSSARGHKSVDFVDSVMETRKKTLEYCSFPGFRHGELVELPGQMEAPPILHRVTNAQDFNPGFKKFWKKLFLSEASVAIMQDTFWWMFLHRFNLEQGHTEKTDRDKLFDRIADSFVALFTSINADVKDKFLSAYPDCMAQAIYTTFLEAFPESANMFNDSFKQELVNLVHQWFTGLKPIPCTWKNWNVKRLEQKAVKPMEGETLVAAKQMMQAAALNKEVTTVSLDMDSFNKVIEKMGSDQPTRSCTPRGMLREKASATVLQLKRGSGTPQSQSKVSRSGLKLPPLKESHQIGPGPDYERVMFNTRGRSPLIAHYLHMRQLRSYRQPGKKVRRTEIVRMPADGQTYQELINDKLNLSARLSKEYQRICEHTNQEINDLEKKKNIMNREIDFLLRELAFIRNPLDLKILGEQILQLMDRNSPPALMSAELNTPSSSPASGVSECGDHEDVEDKE